MYYRYEQDKKDNKIKVSKNKIYIELKNKVIIETVKIHMYTP